jgi:hypothetical protein
LVELTERDDAELPTVNVTGTFCVTVTAVGAFTVMLAEYEPAARPLGLA